MAINGSSSSPSRQHVYEVTELNKKIKQLLEDKFAFLWISGEISNFKIPSSGHCYFTLKDRHSQISAVMFRTQASALKFKPEDGLSIVGLGRLSVYEPRGAYQVIFEYLEPKGVGALQIAFERLKQRLFDQGLFDQRHKQSIPLIPNKISIVTSPTGAAVRDFIKVAQRRFPNLPLEVVPVSVQGERAPGEIIHAIRWLNQLGTTDVIVLARGGGSIEDLWAFNDEQLARTIFSSTIPIISAIGHETDFTIADFVADLRAPTPSAAAEMAVPSKNELKNQLGNIKHKVYKAIKNSMILFAKQVDGLSSRIVHPRQRVQDMRMRLDDYSIRLHSSINSVLTRRNERLAFSHNLLMHVSPAKTVASMQEQVSALQGASIRQISHLLRERRTTISKNISMLEALNPMAILQRGYSITRALPDRSIVRRANQVTIDQSLEIMLGKGRLTVTVAGIKNETD